MAPNLTNDNAARNHDMASYFDSQYISANSAFNHATLDGAIGKLHRQNTDAAKKLFHCDKDEFTLHGPKFGSRKQKFANTVKTFAKGGACVGALLAEGIMFEADFFAGKGGKSRNLLSRGIFGYSLRGATEIASHGAGAIGIGTGFANALFTAPSRRGTGKKFKQHLKDEMSAGFTIASNGTVHTMAAIGGFLLNLLRLPSLLAKRLISSSAAIAAGTVGVVAGTCRAIINK